MEKDGVLLRVLSLYACFSIVWLHKSDAKMEEEIINKNMLLELSNIGPYVSSPFSMAPFDSLPPTSLPQNTPPYCVYSPPPTLSTPTDSPPQPRLPGPTQVPPAQPIPSPPISEPILPGPNLPTPIGPPNSGPILPPGIGPPISGPSPSIPSPRFLPPVVYPPPTVPPPPSRAPATAMWCVAKASVPEPIIEEAMNYACGSGADCGGIQPNGPCFQPNTLFAHASYAFNSYWQRTKVTGGTCDFGGTALLVSVDPSYDGCRFVYF